MNKIYRLTESDLLSVVKKIIKEDKWTYFSTFSDAVQYARQYIEK
jgi:hypothetical protein